MSAKSKLRVVSDNTAPQPETSCTTELRDECAAKMKPAPLHWFWKDRMEWGTVVMFQGAKCAGKSTWLRTLAAHVSGGPQIPGVERTKKDIGGVLWYAGEELLKPRVLPALMACGAVRAGRSVPLIF